jgi:L-ornithine Nalpha-acyltransferase
MKIVSTHLTPSILSHGTSLHRRGHLEVRIATLPEEITAAQALRYAIFYDEMGATPSEKSARARLDIDPYDSICDHLLVIDHSHDSPTVVGTYRLLRQIVASQHDGFYSAQEYDLSKLLTYNQQRNEEGASPRQLLELGRSCVSAPYRNAATINLLWCGLSYYLQTHKVRFLFGCASLPGTNVEDHREALAYLYHNHLLPENLRVRTLEPFYVDMNQDVKDNIDSRNAMRKLSPLIKGYLRAGCQVGDGAFVDKQFNTTDVFIVLPMEAVTQRYSDRFNVGANDS